MKTLYLLRHAEAVPHVSGEDITRYLTPEGVKQAQDIAPYIKGVSLALCSTARRTKMTLENIKIASKTAGTKISKTKYKARLYNAPAADILGIIQQTEADNILVIAHNPGIHDLARRLAGDGPLCMLDQLNKFYHPATLSVLECPIDAWKDLKLEQNTLINLVSPK